MSDVSEEPAGVMDWRQRVIVGRELGARSLPPWAAGSYGILHEQVTNDAYPCFFGVQAELRGEMFYAFISRGEEAQLPAAMATFAELAKQPAYEKNNIAVFFEPDPQPLNHRAYHDIFWRVLQSLHDVDTHPHATGQVDPNDPTWEFCYQGVEMFVVCACPSFSKRHSRNLGPGMVLLFQPRSVFIDKITNKAIGRRARNEVRKRLRVWDEVEPHPDLGFYGDPGNLEWKQYFLPDDNTPHVDACPFMRRTASSAGGQDVPLTSAQEALWYLWRMDPDGSAHHTSCAMRLEGNVEPRVLREALLAVMDRHPALCVRFINEGRALFQRRTPSADAALDWLDLDLRSLPQPMARAREILRERGNASFDLLGDVRLRVTLIEVSAGSWLLQLCTHGISADSGVLHGVQRELLERYAELRGMSVSMPASVADESSMQRASGAPYDAHARAADLAYWRKRLAGGTETLELPLDRRRPALQPAASERLSAVLPSRVAAEVQRLASRLHATPFAVMLGAFALLLQRYSGERDLKIAVPVRHDLQMTANSAGPTSNPAVVRLNVAPGEGFASLVEQTERYLAEARIHGRLPFASVVQSIAGPRTMSSTPLCQVMCSELPAMMEGLCGDFRIRAFDDAIGRGQYDLALNVALSDREIALFMDYSSSLFHTSTVQRMLSHYVALLEHLTHSASSVARPMASVDLRHADRVAAAAA